MKRDFALPDLGEGLTESELVAWHVAVGDEVTLNQTLADVETAKAIVQLPSPFAGTITALYAEEGATVQVGAPLVGFELDGADDAAAEAPDTAAEAPAKRSAVLVGYGAIAESGSRPQRRTRKTAAPAEPATAGAALSPTEAIEAPAQGPALATPPVRKLAHDLGVDLRALSGSGEGGVITREDVRAAAGAAPAAPAASGTVGGARDDVRIPIKGVRKATAAAMVASAFTAPHVTEFLTVDVTPSLELVARLKARGQRASLLALAAKAMCLAAVRTPEVNSRWDEAAGEIVQFGHVNLGVAVATPRGLMVPVVQRADECRLDELTESIAALARAARAGEATPAQLTGGTLSITNVGVFGVDAGTPILVPGEAAILATGAVRRLPWEHEGEIALRQVMTLALSFDHRLVDGEQGSRFLVDVGTILADPGSALAL